MELNEEQAGRINHAMSLVAAERVRQLQTGRTPERDMLYHQCELRRAAASYVIPQGYRNHNGDGVPKMWPFPPSTFQPGGQTHEGVISDLVKAGALILAEIERLTTKRIASEERRANSRG